jgi:glycosyltransferase involved in cell wall biosynthesis
MNVSIIVIGYNEAKNLHNTFNAIKSISYPNRNMEIIYVDSDSNDGSVDIAKEYADKVIIEYNLYRTAARGRNRGLTEAKGSIVHFVDGDVEIDPDYLKNALDVLADDNIHAVTGRLVEKNNRNNIYSRILSSSWLNCKEGFIESCVAGGTFKKNTILKINGYDERIKQGEETELGIRFRKAGYKIYFIENIMGSHDYSINRLKDYLRIFIKDGEAKSVQMMQKEHNIYYHNVRLSAIKNIAHNILILSIIIISILSKYSILLIAIFIYLNYLIIKYYFYKRINKIWQLLYFILMNLLKPLTFWGQLKSLINALVSKRYRHLIITDKKILN